MLKFIHAETKEIVEVFDFLVKCVYSIEVDCKGLATSLWN